LLKESSKELAEKAEALAHELTQKLYTIPNLPYDLVPEGKTPEDNLTVFQEAKFPRCTKARSRIGNCSRNMTSSILNSA
jgi:seryl-tRNA synthetase